MIRSTNQDQKHITRETKVTSENDTYFKSEKMANYMILNFDSKVTSG